MTRVPNSHLKVSLFCLLGCGYKRQRQLRLPIKGMRVAFFNCSALCLEALPVTKC